MNKNRKKLINVLIYGAGSAGKKLKISLDNNPVYKVRGFVDDDLKLQKSKIKGKNPSQSDPKASQNEVKT